MWKQNGKTKKKANARLSQLRNRLKPFRASPAGFRPSHFSLPASRAPCEPRAAHSGFLNPAALELDLSGCSFVPKSVFKQLGFSCPRIVHLNLSMCTQVKKKKNESCWTAGGEVKKERWDARGCVFWGGGGGSCGEEANIDWSMVTAKAALVRNYFGGLLALCQRTLGSERHRYAIA